MAVRCLVVLALAAAACTGRGPTTVGSQPSWRSSKQVNAPQRSVTLGPTTTAVARYNEPVTAPPPSPLGDAIVAAVRAAAAKGHTQVPVPDARLFRACTELAQVVPEDGIIAYPLIEFALQRNGIIEPSPNLLVVWGDLDSPQLIVDQLQPRLAEILADGDTARVGVGAAARMPDGSGAVVFALQASGVTTAPIPRALPAGGSFALDATVDPRFRDAELLVTHHDGSVERAELRPGRAGGVTAPIRCGASAGKQQIEIAARDAQGSKVLANFPVWCGAQPPASITVDPSLDDLPIADPLEAERRVLALVNRDRAAADLPPLAWDERVANVARAHSQEMRRSKIVAHISTTTGSAADRVRAAKIKTAVVLENVARAYGVGEAHQGLMNSPGHRANVLSSAATHIGIGIEYGDDVAGRREIFITQVFTRVPQKLERTAATELIRKRIAAIRAVGTNPALSGIAQSLAAELAAGKTREQAYTPLKPRVDALASQYIRVGSVITTTADVDTLDAASILGDSKPDDIGIGIGQGSHPDFGDSAIFVVVLLATRR